MESIFWVQNLRYGEMAYWYDMGDSLYYAIMNVLINTILVEKVHDLHSLCDNAIAI